MPRTSMKIDIDEFNRLEKDSDFLKCLMDCGAEAWHGYEDAVYLMEENKRKWPDTL